MLRRPLTAPLCAVLCVAAAAVVSPVQSQTVPPATTPVTETQVIEALIRERKYDDALTRLDALLATSPRNAQARFLRGVVLTDTGKSTEAAAAFEAMTQDFPELPEPYNNLAVIHAGAGRYDVARSLLLRAIDVAPNYLTARENLGDLYVAMSADAYARALSLAPASEGLKRKLQLVRDVDSRLRPAR